MRAWFWALARKEGRLAEGAIMSHSVRHTVAKWRSEVCLPWRLRSDSAQQKRSERAIRAKKQN
jgi:hypothetical protein